MREAFAAGQRCFGENYVQEGLTKIEALADLRPQLEWHLIGPLQSNKTREVAAHFDWVHGIDRLKIAERLSAQRPEGTCRRCRSACRSTSAARRARRAWRRARCSRWRGRWRRLPRLVLRGLMSIPEPAEGEAAQRAPHRALRELRDALNREGLALDTLSMGMSADLDAAVAEGSTIVRIGTAIFGARSAPPSA